ncbi:MAG: GNAT family N-acetyltransferase [Oculatellaceae cyanobacterium bins.114]|nr:GNAT family N-acetyltransferase [Oculatellaceae cyanobacterium bins.114]
MNSVCENSPFLIRGARQQDLGTLAEVLTHSFHTKDGVLGLMYPLLRLGIYEDLRTRLRTQAPHYACIVAVKRSPLTESLVKINNPAVAAITEALAGTVEIGLRAQSPWQVRSQQYLYLSNLAVGTDYRRQGVALQLLKACEGIALKWGYKDLYLHVLENNQPARQLYLKAGYQVHREESGLGTWFLGQPRQLLLRKQLGG